MHSKNFATQECGPQTGRVRITWELVRKRFSSLAPDLWIRICILMRSVGYLYIYIKV